MVTASNLYPKFRLADRKNANYHAVIIPAQPAHYYTLYNNTGALATAAQKGGIFLKTEADATGGRYIVRRRVFTWQG